MPCTLAKAGWWLLYFHYLIFSSLVCLLCTTIVPPLYGRGRCISLIKNCVCWNGGVILNNLSTQMRRFIVPCLNSIFRVILSVVFKMQHWKFEGKKDSWHELCVDWTIENYMTNTANPHWLMLSEFYSVCLYLLNIIVHQAAFILCLACLNRSVHLIKKKYML